MSEDLPFALMRWIKEQQRLDQEHREYMGRKNAEDDKLYTGMILQLLMRFKLSMKETMLFKSMMLAKEQGKNLTTGQKSFIANLYYRKTN